MSKWLALLNELSSNPKLTMLTKDASVSFVSEQSQVVPNLTPELQRLENVRQACLEVRTWPHYRQFSPATLQAESDALERLSKKIQKLRTE